MRLDRRPGRRRVITVTLAVGFLLSSCASSKAPDADPSATASPTSTNGAPGSMDVIAAIFPATAQDSRIAGKYLEFKGRIRDRLRKDCMKAQGFEDKQAPTPDNQRFADYPDPETLRRVGFGIVDAQGGTPAPLEPTAGMTAAQAQAYTAALGPCSAKGDDVFADVDRSVQPLFSAWGETAVRANSDPKVQTAFGAWRDCMRSKGLDVKDEAGFFDRVDSSVQRLERNVAAAKAEELRLASDYADCILPVVEVRDPLRVRLRTDFLDAHAEDVRQASAKLDALVRRLASSYDVAAPG